MSALCFDACHMAVEFEDHAASLAALDRAGIRVPKFQISSALRVSDPSRGIGLAAAPSRASPRTPICTRWSRDRIEALRRYVDLPDALAARATTVPTPIEWRVHFHVPVFLQTMGALDTTQPDLEAVLDLVQARSRLRHVSKSRPTPGTCCRPSTAPTTSAKRLHGSCRGRARGWKRNGQTRIDRGSGRQAFAAARLPAARAASRTCRRSGPTCWPRIVLARRIARLAGRSRRSPPPRSSTSAGMFLNDAFDAPFDARRAPRPADPDRRVSRARSIRDRHRAAACGRAAAGVACRIATAGAAVGTWRWPPRSCSTTIATKASRSVRW